MAIDLNSRQSKALAALRFECDYEDHHKGGSENFISRSALPVGIGIETLESLVRLGLAIKGPNRWTGEEGYRITDIGRDSL